MAVVAGRAAEGLSRAEPCHCESINPQAREHGQLDGVHRHGECKRRSDEQGD
jgi:hypothetical protein